MDETNVVPETNLDDAVSYTKGCYVGQEIIVRIKHRGHPAKKLTGLRFETDQQIEPGAIIKIDRESGDRARDFSGDFAAAGKHRTRLRSL